MDPNVVFNLNPFAFDPLSSLALMSQLKINTYMVIAYSPVSVDQGIYEQLASERQIHYHSLCFASHHVIRLLDNYHLHIWHCTDLGTSSNLLPLLGGTDSVLTAAMPRGGKKPIMQITLLLQTSLHHALVSADTIFYGTHKISLGSQEKIILSLVTTIHLVALE